MDAARSLEGVFQAGMHATRMNVYSVCLARLSVLVHFTLAKTGDRQSAVFSIQFTREY